jgi:hypothetical protein
MALRAVTAKGVAIGTIVGVVTSASLLLRLPRRSVKPAPVLVTRSLPTVVASLPALLVPEPEWLPPEPRPDVVSAAATPVLIQSRTLTPVVATRSDRPEGEVPPATMSFDEAGVAPLASRPIAVVVVSDEAREMTGAKPGAITRAMGTTSRAFRVAGTSVANAFRKVF